MNGERIDRFLSGNLEDLSRSYIQKLLKDEKILVNGRQTTSYQRGMRSQSAFRSPRSWISCPRIFHLTFCTRTTISLL